MIKVTERGWPGHFICSDSCIFRRNTLIESEYDSVVVSTVGSMLSTDRKRIETIGASGRYYETMVFGSKIDGVYIEANVSDQRDFKSEWAICAESPDKLPKDIDNKANEMHDAVVVEFIDKLSTEEEEKT